MKNLPNHLIARVYTGSNAKPYAERSADDISFVAEGIMIIFAKGESGAAKLWHLIPWHNVDRLEYGPADEDEQAEEK